MNIAQPKLPYELDALEPHVSKETMRYHFEKHHRGYFDKLEKLVAGTPYETLTLEEIIDRARESAQLDILNNALQVWNHRFLWSSMSPNGGQKPNGRISKLVEDSFGDIDTFKREFRDAALSVFGSGWTWLVEDRGKLRIITSGNADSPVGTALTPLLVIDVWEHAYYIDHRNDRARFVDTFLSRLINWDFAAANLREEQKRKAA